MALREDAPADYFVRLRPGAPDPLPRDSHPPRTDERARPRRVKKRHIVLAAVLLWVAWDPSAARQEVAGVWHAVSAPLRSFDGERELREATTALSDYWNAYGSYAAGIADLERIAPDLDWGESINAVPCLGGRAVVIRASTLRGSVSRLLLNGNDEGDVVGEPACPGNASELGPWESIR